MKLRVEKAAFRDPDPSVRNAWNELNEQIVACARCPRLIAHCRRIAADRRASFRDQAYHGRPVPNWGDPYGALLLVGLAPAAHGANRTGRMFTGDRSGDFLYGAMYQTGFATQPSATSADDGLELRNAAITAAAHCAPPGNRPTPQELDTCSPFLERTLLAMPRLRVVLCLGSIAHGVMLRHYRARGVVQRLSDFPFRHGAEYPFHGHPLILCTYHPSQQNTFTGRLTEVMLRDVFARAAAIIGQAQ
jgi:uracil-DNA glycosylase family 4